MYKQTFVIEILTAEPISTLPRLFVDLEEFNSHFDDGTDVAFAGKISNIESTQVPDLEIPFVLKDLSLSVEDISCLNWQVGEIAYLPASEPGDNWYGFEDHQVKIKAIDSTTLIALVQLLDYENIELTIPVWALED